MSLTEEHLAEIAWTTITLAEHTEAGTPTSIALARTASELRTTVAEVKRLSRIGATLAAQATA